MIPRRFINDLFLLQLLTLLFWICQPLNAQEANQNLSSEKVNLALRRTADGLLRAYGDSTSRIPAVEQTADHVWQLRIDQPFLYDQLPALLQSSLDQYEIKQAYQVAVRRCTDEVIDLGFHQKDVLNNNTVPCKGRDFPEGCHFIEITFLDAAANKTTWTTKTSLLLLVFVGLLGYLFYHRRKTIPIATNGETEWMEFGNSRLDVSNQELICNEVRQTLTFRETKLLRLFVINPDQLLERDYIMQQVWEDEGIFVGRSVDVFVSRLRKKLAADASVGIVAVHGVGYRLETGKVV